METASLSRNERRLKLLHWGFSCACHICSLGDSELKKNENMLKEFREAKISLQRCPTDPFNVHSLKDQMKIERQTRRESMVSSESSLDLTFELT